MVSASNEALVSSLRAEAVALRKAGNRDEAARLLRSLRRLADLSPNEHRRLFRALRTRKGAVLDRYLQLLARTQPTAENWKRVAAALWCEGRFGDLFRWSERHPDGMKAAAAFLLGCGGISAKNREPEAARAIARQIETWHIDGPSVAAARRLRGSIEEGSAPAVRREVAPAVASKPKQRAKVQARVPQRPTATRTRAERARRAVELRAAIAGFRAEGRRRDAVSALRELRRLVPLRPSEHRYLFRGLRQFGREGVITRYARLAERAEPGRADWNRVALALWSEARLEALSSWLANHPRGPEAAKKVLSGLVGVSLKHHESDVALALLDILVERHPTDRELSSRRCRLLLDLGQAKRLLAEIEGHADPVTRIEALADLIEHGSRRAPGEAGPAVGASLAELAFASEAWRREAAASLRIIDTRFAALAPAFAKYYAECGDPARALALYAGIPARTLADDGWLQAVKLAIAQSDPAAAVEFARRAAINGGSRGAARASELLAGAGLVDALPDVWLNIERDGPRLRTATGIVRSLHKSGRHAMAFEHGIAALRALWPFEGLGPIDQDRLVTLARLIVRAGIDGRVYLAAEQNWPARFTGSKTAIGRFVEAMVHAALQDGERAVCCLEAAAGSEEPPPSVLHIPTEIALLHLRHYRFGEARRVLEEVGEAGKGPYYDRELRLMREVSGFVSDPDHYPECLVDVIFEELERDGPLGYLPDAGHLVTITGSLAQGGSERQTVNVVRGFCSDARIARQTVLVRSLEGENGFFLPVLADRPVTTLLYGENWRLASNLHDENSILATRPRLLKAVSLLPHNMREDIVRVIRQILVLRPEVAHVRQDLVAPAIACAIAGVPTFFIHRGSLARDTWDHSPLGLDTTLRPMRHIYRRLLEKTSFFIVNNSVAGRTSDREWLDWPDSSRFHVVHNIVDFDRLGRNSGRNVGLRAELGIKPEAPVVGGVFRLASVKRPMLWIEIARRVLSRLPDAHFILVGDDGEYGEEVRAFAARHGFAERLHMPGPVSDVGDWYRAMDVLLLTSDREGLPNVNIEAQHFGLPVVSSDVGGASETLENGITGYLVRPHDGPDVFAERIVSALTDPNWKRRARAIAPQFVHRSFGISNTLDKLAHLYSLSGADLDGFEMTRGRLSLRDHRLPRGRLH